MKESLQKYFIALLPDAYIQEEIMNIKRYLAEEYGTKAALKSPPHITLHMPFDWPENDEEKLFNALDKFVDNQQTFPVIIQGFNAFSPRVVFVDVEKTVFLEKITNALVQYLRENLGIQVYKQKKDRPFNPHITLAFRDLNPSTFQEIWEEYKDKHIEFDFIATHITLLKHNGKYWDIYKNFPLKKESGN